LVLRRELVKAGVPTNRKGVPCLSRLLQVRWAKVHVWVVSPVCDGLGVPRGDDKRTAAARIPGEDIDGD
jgi:hypothetical protein